ncbi:YbjQ family protein [Curtobacterium sp. RRHDQ10]|uniref:YbjQ family protein n=1 Tax=Curtobacterium phyllosphaerae TaxID=3413379 RepID=UPI003BF36C62
MLVATTNDLPGAQITEVLGEVMGLTVRARNFGVQFGASFQALVGGELTGLTAQLVQTRDEAMNRMIEHALYRGADAIVAMRFDANEIGNGYQEVVAYGTAVRVLWPRPTPSE